MKAKASNGSQENQSAKTNRENCQCFVDELVGGLLQEMEVGEGNICKGNRGWNSF